MNSSTEGWESDCRVAGRDALQVIVEQQMRYRVSWYLEETARLGGVDRRNGSFPRHLVTELGDIELHVPRSRRFSLLSVVRTFARRARQVDQAILTCFVLGLSTRKIAAALLPVLGGQSVLRRFSGGTKLGSSGRDLLSAIDHEAVSVFGPGWGGAQTQNRCWGGQTGSVGGLGYYP
jgi:hypothetical protein